MQQSPKASLVRFFVGVIAVVLLIVLSMGTAGCTSTHPQAKPPEPAQVRNLEDNDRPGSLRYAIEKALAGSTITFDARLRGKLLLTSNLYIAKDLTIRGPGAGRISMSSGKSGYSVYVVRHTIVAISGLTFKDSNTATGFIDNQGSLTLTSSTVSGNTATDDGAGGGISNSGTLTLSNSTISGNTTTGINNGSAGISNESGGIYNTGTLTLSNSTISGNTAISNSTGTGGIYNNSTLMISNSTISGNRSKYIGGINNDKNGTLMISNSTISGNDAGGIFNTGTLMISNSTISGNTGGGIDNFEATVTLSNSTISGNKVAGSGGGGIDNSGTLTLSNSTISGNSTTIVIGANGGGGVTAGSGGGILNELNGTLRLSNSTIFGNTAQYSGGGITNVGTFTLTNSTISGNMAGDGGGIDNEGTLILTNSTISGNSAKDGGGGISNFGTLTLTNSTISGNTATGNGGGIFIQSGTFSGNPPDIAQATLIFSTIYGNRASAGVAIAIQDIDNDNNMPIKQISHVKISNSIVAGDPAHPGPDIVGTLTSYGYNLFQDNSGATFDPATNKQHGTDKFLSANDLSNLFAAPTALQNNGGSTMTYALAPGSPALDAIPLQYCLVKDIFNSQLGMYTDQRGMKRPDVNEQFCDIGAYESD